MGIMMACLAEVASQFSDAGGAYLYARSVFGPFVGIQVGWFSWLSRVASGAAAAALFGTYCGGVLPLLGKSFWPVLLVALMLGTLVTLNYVGVKSGARVSTTTLIARLLPLTLLIVVAIPRLGQHSAVADVLAIRGHSGSNWFEALLLISFMYGGYETAMMALGEVKDPRKSAPFALGIGFLVCVLVYSLCQWVVVATVGANSTARPLADAAGMLMGPAGALIISLAALVSTVGYLSACVLNVPRLMYAISEQGDLPHWFTRVHPRFRTPHVAIAVFGILVFVLAVTGGFRFAVTISAGARLVTYGSACAALIPLRRREKDGNAFVLPLGPLFSVLSVLMVLVMVAAVRSSGAIVMLITFFLALINWMIVRGRRRAVAAVR